MDIHIVDKKNCDEKKRLLRFQHFSKGETEFDGVCNKKMQNVSTTKNGNNNDRVDNSFVRTLNDVAMTKILA